MTSGVSFTKLRGVLYDQLTCRSSHELVLLANCYNALGCIGHALHHVTPRIASCIGMRELDIWTRCTSIFVKDPPWYVPCMSQSLYAPWELSCISENNFAESPSPLVQWTTVGLLPETLRCFLCLLYVAKHVESIWCKQLNKTKTSKTVCQNNFMKTLL